MGYAGSAGQMDFKVEYSIRPGLYDNTTVDGVNVDLNGKDGASVLFTVFVGATDTAVSALRVETSETGSGGWTVVGTFDSAAPSATDDNTQYLQFVERTKLKRYNKIVAVVGDGTAGANLCGTVHFFGLGYPPNPKIASSYGSGVKKVAIAG